MHSAAGGEPTPSFAAPVGGVGGVLLELVVVDELSVGAPLGADAPCGGVLPLLGA